jgi:hypothetical protein
MLSVVPTLFLLSLRQVLLLALHTAASTFDILDNVLFEGMGLKNSVLVRDTSLSGNTVDAVRSAVLVDDQLMSVVINVNIVGVNSDIVVVTE